MSASDAWAQLKLGYPGENEAARACFDVLAPELRGQSGIRYGVRHPIYDVTVETPTPDEVWDLAVELAQAVAAVIHNPTRH